MGQGVLHSILEWLAPLPFYLQPTALVLFVAVMGWFFFFRSGIRTATAVGVRVFARVADWLVGLSLLPRYVVSRRWRRSGVRARSALTMRERILDVTSSWEKRCRSWTVSKRPWPWKGLFVFGVVLAIPWAGSVVMPRNRDFIAQVEEAYVPWQALRVWAEVVPDDKGVIALRGRRNRLLLRVRLGTENAFSAAILRRAISNNPARDRNGPSLRVRLNSIGNGRVTVPRRSRARYRAGMQVEILRSGFVVARLQIKGAARAAKHAGHAVRSKVPRKGVG